MEIKRLFKKGDIYIIVLIVAISFMSLSWKFFYTQAQDKSRQSLIAGVIVDRKLVKEIDLNQVKEPQAIKLGDGINLTILAEHGRIRIEYSDCPDKFCVQTGWLTQPGDIAVCLPKKAILTIK